MLIAASVASANGAAFTGHELLTHVGAWGLFDGLGGFDPRSMPGVDYFGIDAFRTATTVDAADYAPQLSAKFGDSVARANGRHRCTIEQYATGRETGTAGLAGQWGLTLERFRAQAIRHLLFGARQILLHAYTASDGFEDDPRLGINPRFDFPPGFNFEPWWEDCPAVFTELARLSAFLEDGTPLRPVALFYPLETIRAEAMAPACGQHFGWWAEALARAGLGYDILDERQLGGLATSTYAALILPATTTLANTASAEIIARWVDAGGSLLASGPLPSKTRAIGLAPGLAEVWRGVAATGRLLHLPHANQPAIDEAVAALPHPRPSLRLDDGPCWNTIARCGDTWRIAAFNDQDVARTLTIALDDATDEVTRWDPDTGTTEVLSGIVRNGVLILSLPAHGLVCLSIETRPQRADTAAEQHSNTPAASHDAATVHGAALPTAPRSSATASTDARPPAPILLADDWTFERRGTGVVQPIAVDRGWEVQGFDTFAGTGIYRRPLALPPLPDGFSWHLVLPGLSETAECHVDGRLIGRHVAGTARFPLPPTATQLELHVRNTAANRYYPGTPYWDGVPQPSGLTAVPRLEAVRDGVT